MTGRSVVLTLAAPLQSWGASPKGSIRKTEQFPTRSGVLGMVAAAMGLPHDTWAEKLAGLKFGVRCDHPGSTLVDLHTANLYKWSARRGWTWAKTTTPTQREYVADGVFTAALSTGDDALLSDMHAALREPTFAPYLGRRGAVPGTPVYPPNRDIFPGGVLDALTEHPWAAPGWVQRARHRERQWESSGAPESDQDPNGIVREAVQALVDPELVSDPERRGGLRTVMDVPCGERVFASRAASSVTLHVPAPPPVAPSRPHSAGLLGHDAWWASARDERPFWERGSAVPALPADHDPFDLLT